MKNFSQLIKSSPWLLKLYVGLIYKRNPISKSAERLYNKYANNYSLKQLDVDFVKRDVLYSALKWGIRADEYFRYSFFNLSDHGRKQYVSEYELDLRYKDDPKIIELLNDKYACYQHFKQFYNRDVEFVSQSTDIGKFERFVTKHPVFIVKPLSAHGGEGVYKFSIHSSSIQEAFSKITEEGSAVIEELIVQGEGMSIFHPQSINTVRIVTYNDNGRVEIVQSSVRLGTGDSVVDNGCLSASVDPITGIISSLGRSAHEEKLCMFHPDTNVQILGYQIPEWDSLKKYVVQLPLQAPTQRVIGWDLALSKTGWVMIEGNAHPSIQILSGNGVGARQLFEKLVK